MYFFYKVLVLVIGGSVVNGAYPIYFTNVARLLIGQLRKYVAGVRDPLFVYYAMRHSLSSPLKNRLIFKFLVKMKNKFTFFGSKVIFPKN